MVRNKELEHLPLSYLFFSWSSSLRHSQLPSLKMAQRRFTISPWQILSPPFCYSHFFSAPVWSPSPQDTVFINCSCVGFPQAPENLFLIENMFLCGLLPMGCSSCQDSAVTWALQGWRFFQDISTCHNMRFSVGCTVDTWSTLVLHSYSSLLYCPSSSSPFDVYRAVS